MSLGSIWGGDYRPRVGIPANPLVGAFGAWWNPPLARANRGVPRRAGTF